jgi:hypothetical protein
MRKFYPKAQSMQVLKKGSGQRHCENRRPSA